MNRRTAARLRWFDEGAPLLRRFLAQIGEADALPADEEYYACPCCLVGYERECVLNGTMTDEHVPPRQLGGKRLVLTCANCNNTAGNQFDAHAVERSRAMDFMMGRPSGRRFKATMHADGIPLRGTARWTDEGSLELLGVPKQNDPKQQAAHVAALDSYVDRQDPNPNASFTIQLNYEEARARYSWTRSAYLAAFAGLGWWYIFRDVMQPIRDQLANPDAKILPTYMFSDPTRPAEDRRILIVSEPDDLRCVAVMMGQHVIFLPGINRPQTFDEVAEAFKARQVAGHLLTTTLDGQEVPWPRYPMYYLDRLAGSA